jgi:hypothetical protein
LLLQARSTGMLPLPATYIVNETCVTHDQSLCRGSQCNHYLRHNRQAALPSRSSVRGR